MMSGGWTRATPRMPRGSRWSQRGDGGDGRRQARVWCSLAREDGTIVPVVPVWFDESGAAVAWQPTHWRPVPSGTTRGCAFTVE